MASGSDEVEKKESSSWWGNLVKSAKEKSMNALEIMKTDLAEFTETMTTDTTNIINQATSHFLDTTSILNDNQTPGVQETRKKAEPIVSSRVGMHERYLHELSLLHANEDTYLTDPKLEDMTEYREWQQSFTPEAQTTIISEILIDNSEMRLLYSQLVPAKISNHEFWSRYFFKVNTLEEEHKKRVKFIERATSSTHDADHKEESWDDEPEPETETETKTPSDAGADKANITEQVIDQPGEKEPPATTIASETISNTQAQETDNLDAKTKSEENEEAKHTASSDEALSKGSSGEIVQKTEDSDEWDNVADSQLASDNENKPEPEKAAQSATEDSNKDQEESQKKKEKQKEDDWDEWE